jgi:two-component system, OmpR family, response regulator
VLVPRIAIVDDDFYFASSLKTVLQSTGYRPTLVSVNGDDYLRSLSGFDLIILDINLPGFSGLDLARSLRRNSTVPIIIISGTQTPNAGVTALRSGGDDFVKKPFDTDELIERIGALLRRSNNREGSSRGAHIGTWLLDVNATSLCDPQTGVSLHLTEREFAILSMLLASLGTCVSREQVAAQICGREWNPQDRSIDVHVSNLRKKLRAVNISQIAIKSLRNQGYVAYRAEP